MLIHQQERPSQGHLHRMHVQRVVEQQSTSSVSSLSSTATAIVLENSYKRKEKPATPVKSEFDTKNQVHIIHVNARDEYEHVISSQQFADILHKQKPDPKEHSASTSLITDDQQEELEGREEGDDSTDEKSAATLDMIANTPSQQSADLRRRQRNGFDSTISAKNKASELEEESLEEYFDSAFYTSLAVTNRFCTFAAFISIFACFALS
uniref:Uncharacterized protein n=1 Tax=Ditylenchus dipsaci TaxID=166011 RepID=A0A915DFI6_9BILA